jgi:hypothetical protein
MAGYAQCVGIPTAPVVADDRDLEEWSLRERLEQLAATSGDLSTLSPHSLRSAVVLVQKSFSFTPRQQVVASLRTLLADDSAAEIAYECCVCFELFSSAEYRWDCRHVVCNGCGHILDACPICRTTDDSARGTTVVVTEEMARLGQRLHALACQRMNRP